MTCHCLRASDFYLVGGLEQEFDFPYMGKLFIIFESTNSWTSSGGVDAGTSIAPWTSGILMLLRDTFPMFGYVW